ncbi:uncharacterized protein CPUR_07972 [Claviceps purpurea 20.1]|uniref:R3H domain-containing protein n=1 Tax=Claviceps purpurea (strain 20.1) TaxID=1111077 RepID=M1W5F3_CLAP2|nr:hypothetical protein E4U51_003158 [Claviceps purpurea]KAG6250061.1 hypothetical protein E4U24_001882 [Claviceps purpurea]CCE34041.1 uncharacterized protein CPUR_07972 [Claviceps purpurea 20.1]
MATTRASPDIPKPSFAMIAASVKKEVSHALPASANKSSIPSTAAVIADGSTNFDNKPHLAGDSDGLTTVSSALDRLCLVSKIPSLVVDGSGSIPERQKSNLSRETPSDESQKCDSSSSELGTKPPSLDGKSITSGTTFALDEKESLRPDDSASVKAAAEDDDTLSIRGSLVAGSRMSSDVALRTKGVLPVDLADRRPTQVAMVPSPHGILNPSASVPLDHVPALNAATPLNADGSPDALNVIYRQAPDEKLLLALTSPRDRFFLLRLEKDVIDFVQDSKEPYMDLPPSNSFCRMLTHKLADYYHMTHSYEPHVGSVRIFRTPFCRVPPSLANMTPQPDVSSSSTPPPAVLPMKIMRRGQNGDGLMSTNGSKPGSESGSEAKDKLAASQKLSREEREEMYKLARERIFGSSEDVITENDGETGISRTSSVSANNRANATKRGKTGKQRRDDSDSFDSRHQYTAFWGPQQQTWVPQSQGQYIPSAPGQFGGQPPASYHAPVAPCYAQQAPAYQNMPVMAPNSNFPVYGMPQQYPPQPPQQHHPSNGSPMTAYGTPVNPGVAPQATWTQPGYSQTSYPPRTAAAPAPASAPGGSSGQVGIPYAFGQLPAHMNPHDPKSQHPIPGSYNRNHAFNPKTQSFVPGGNGMSGVPPPQPPFNAPLSHHGSPQISTPPHLAYGAYPQSQGYGGGGGYGMARQASSNSVPGYHAMQHAPSPHMQQSQPPNMSVMSGMQAMGHAPSGPPTQHHHLPHPPPGHIPGRPPMPTSQGPNQIYPHLPTYGNPASLPQKPATGI